MRKLNLIEMRIHDISIPFPLTSISTHIFAIQSSAGRQTENLEFSFNSPADQSSETNLKFCFNSLTH